MNKAEQWDDLTLNAYIDGELDSETQNAILGALDHDNRLRERICALRYTNDWMRAGYGNATPAHREPPRRIISRQYLNSRLAASFIALAIGLVSGGVFGYIYADKDSAATHAATQTDPNKIVLHISDAEPEHFQQLLNYAESFLEQHRNRGVLVDVVANAGGLKLLQDTSPYSERVTALRKAHPNVQFIACMNALRNLRKQGIEPNLLDGIHTDTTAIDHIVERLQQGWTYHRIGELPQT